MISDQEYLKDRARKFPLNAVQKRNMQLLLGIINKIRTEWGKPLIVTSGYRDPETNIRCGGSPRSSHLSCEAIDLADPDFEFRQWILDNKILEKYDLYMEDREDAPTWAHLQTRKTASGHRVFKK